MGKISAEANIVISAVNAAHSNQRFLQNRDLQKAYSEVYKLRYLCPNGDLGSIFLSQRPIHNKQKEPVDFRAWTLQQHKLSFHMLRFGSKQLGWKCPQDHYVDGSAILRPTAGDDPYPLYC